MKNKKVLGIIILIALIAITAYACGGVPESPTASPQLAKSLPDHFSFGTKDIGSQNYLTMVGIAPVVQKYTGIKTTIEVTVGSGLQSELLKQGKIDFISTSNYDIAALYNATGEFSKLKPNRELRQVACFYNTQMLLYARSDSGIKKMEDVKGHKIFANCPNTPVITSSWQGLMEFYKIGKEDYTLLQLSSSSDGVAGVKEGRGDGYFWAFGSHILQLQPKPGVNFVTCSKEAAKYCDEKGYDPAAYLAPIDPGARKLYSVPEDVIGGFTHANTLFTRASLSNEAVKAVLAAIFDHYDEYKDTFPNAAQITLDTAVGPGVVPIHPGAVQFFKDRGVWTSDAEANQQKLLKQLESLSK